MDNNKIVILDAACSNLDNLRNDCGELAICLPDSVSITLNIKTEELVDLEKIISEYTNSIELDINDINIYKLKNVHYRKINNVTEYRAFIKLAGISMISGLLYVDKTKENIINGQSTYSMQVIGSHQGWKDFLKNKTLKDLDLGTYTHDEATILDLWENNDVYVDGQDAIYPLMANFGRWFGDDEAIVEDIRFLVYIRAIVIAMFCEAGYKVQSRHLNSDYMRKQADYLLEPCFAQNENIDAAIQTEVTNSAPIPIPIQGVSSDPTLVYDTDVIDVGNNYDNTTGLFEHGRILTCLKLRWKGTVEALVLGGVNIVELYVLVGETGVGTIDNVLVDIFEFTFVGETYDFDIEVDITSIIANAIAGNSRGIFETDYFVVVGGFARPGLSTEIHTGSTLEFITCNCANFNGGDEVPISKVLRDTFSLYDLLLDYRRKYNWRFKTNETTKTVIIEPSPYSYVNYSTDEVGEIELNGFEGNPQNVDDVLDITEYVDICTLIEKDFSKNRGTQSYNFLYKQSTDQYDSYSDYTEENPLWGNILSTNQSDNITKIQLGIFEPTLNDYDFEISSNPDFGIFLPYMWAEAKDQESDLLPEPSSEIEPRTFNVYGWATQLTSNTPPDELGTKFEGATLSAHPNVGQVFPVLLQPDGGGLTYNVIHNNVYKDNVYEFDDKNFVNTYYNDALQDDFDAPTVIIETRLNNFFYKCVDVRKVIRVFSEKNELIRFNGHYRLISLRYNTNTKKATFELKPIIYCTNG